MRLHRFYVENPISNETFDVSDRDLVHQWRDVFRYNVGSQVVLFDGTGLDYLCIITSLRNLGATLTVLEKKENANSFRRNIWVCLAILKKDNFEMALQKVTEIGANHIVPIMSERTEKKNLNMERLEKISTEASEQSGRINIAKVHEIMSVSELLKKNILPTEKIVLHPDGQYIGDYLSANNSKDLSVFIGPEGGWNEGEINKFTTYNIPSISLGPQILRAETAAIAVASLLLL